ncbi:MAG: hypothetical protein Q9165_007988 [Trypethelium subeluteriae]
MPATALLSQHSFRAPKQVSLDFQQFYDGTHPAKPPATTVQRASGDAALETVGKSPVPAILPVQSEGGDPLTLIHKTSAQRTEAIKNIGACVNSQVHGQDTERKTSLDFDPTIGGICTFPNRCAPPTDPGGDQQDRAHASSPHKHTVQPSPSLHVCGTPIRSPQRQKYRSPALNRRDLADLGSSGEADSTSRKRNMDRLGRHDRSSPIKDVQQTDGKACATVPRPAQSRPSTLYQSSQKPINYDRGVTTDGESTGSCELDDTDTSSSGEEYDDDDSVANGSVAVHRKRLLSASNQALLSRARASKSHNGAPKLTNGHQGSSMPYVGQGQPTILDRDAQKARRSVRRRLCREMPNLGTPSWISRGEVTAHDGSDESCCTDTPHPHRSKMNAAACYGLRSRSDLVDHSSLGVIPRRHSRWTTSEDNQLCDLRRQGLSWREIARSFPRRTRGAVQVRYVIIQRKGALLSERDG